MLIEMKKELFIILLLFLLGFPAVRSLLQPGGYTSHDLTHHIVRQISMDKLLSEGQFPPRWSGELNNGYGYPVFLFNYPLPALIGEIFHKTGFNFVDSFKAVLFLSMLLSPIGMYFFLESLLESKLAAFLGAVFYLYAPVRFLNVYVSAAVGSALGAAVLPFVFLSIVKLTKDYSKKWALIGALSLTTLVISHNVTTFIFVPVILYFSVFCYFSPELKDKKIFLRNLSLMFVLGIGLSAWFWVPALIEKQYIIFDSVLANYYVSQFPLINQIIYSPWGYGLSHPQSPQPGDMSYQLGLAHIFVILIYSLLYFVIGRKSRTKMLGLFVLITIAVSIFFMLKISLPVWKSLPFLNLIQFPLRFQAITVFSISIASALLIKYLPQRKFIFIVLLIVVIYANRNHWNINEVFNPGDNYYLSLKTTTASFDEHLPKWGRRVDKPALSKLEIIEGSGKVSILDDKSNMVLAKVEVTASSGLRLNQFYFPGWQIEVDGKKVDFNYLLDGFSHGLPVFKLPSGSHLVKAEFRNTTVRNLADGISLVSVIILGVLVCKLLIHK